MGSFDSGVLILVVTIEDKVMLKVRYECIYNLKSVIFDIHTIFVLISLAPSIKSPFTPIL